MKNWMIWTLATLILAVVLHFGAVWYIPNLMTKMAFNAIKARNADWKPNKLNFNGMRFAGEDVIVQSNPDVLNSSGMYDVSSKPVRVHCVIPEGDSYWSVSLFAWNTDNFYVLNDRKAKSREFDLVIVKENSKYKAKEAEEIVVSPSNQGAILIRQNLTDRNNLAEVERISAIQKKSTMEVVENTEY